MKQKRKSRTMNDENRKTDNRRKRNKVTLDGGVFATNMQEKQIGK